MRGWLADCVGVDNVQIGWNLAEHVVSNGAKRILFVCHVDKSGAHDDSPALHRDRAGGGGDAGVAAAGSVHRAAARLRVCAASSARVDDEPH